MKAVQQKANMGNVAKLAMRLSNKQRMKQVKHQDSQSLEAVGKVKTIGDTYDNI